MKNKIMIYFILPILLVLTTGCVSIVSHTKTVYNQPNAITFENELAAAYMKLAVNDRPSGSTDLYIGIYIVDFYTRRAVFTNDVVMNRAKMSADADGNCEITLSEAKIFYEQHRKQSKRSSDASILNEYNEDGSRKKKDTKTKKETKAKEPQSTS